MSAVAVLGVDGRPLDASAAALLRTARLVVGAARHLERMPVPAEAERLVLGDLAAGVQAVRAHPGPAVVLASGDPGFFGVVRALRAAGLDVDVHPALSSVAAAFGRVAESWDDAVVVSAHGRDLRRAVNVCRAVDKVAVLTGPGAGPAELAAALSATSRRGARLVVAERVGAADECVTETTVAAAAGRGWSDPNVVLLLPEAPSVAPGASGPGWSAPRRQAPVEWALPDDAFEHRDGMVTKREVRAMALARLGPGLGDLVWDVGTGCGSVAVECARFGAAVVALDRDEAQTERARLNAVRHAVHLDVLSASAPECLPALPDPDAVYVGGGGPSVVAAAAARARRVVVVALAALDRVAPARAALADAGLHVEGVQLGGARLAELPDGTSRLAATNPVFLLWGRR